MTTDNDEAMAAVLYYLRKMGYRQTERFFREEAHITGMEMMAFELKNEQDSNIANYLLFSSQALDVSAYSDAYEGLRKWIYESLDAFRDQLLPILFPLYVHLTLDMLSKSATTEAKSFQERFKSEHLDAHEDEMTRLCSITDASQLRENPLAMAFRTNKYNVVNVSVCFSTVDEFLAR